MPFSRGGGSGRRRRSSGPTMPACWSVTGGRRTATSPPPPIKPVWPICCAARATWARDHPRAPFAARVTITLQQALGIRDRRVAGVISPHGAAVARGHVLTHLFTALDHVGSVPDMQRFAAHLSTELPALFSFLFDPAVDATNWRAEHALRPAVVNRKVCGGNRSARGAHTQQVLTSVLRTAQQRQLDASEVLVELLRAPQPTVSQTLAPPPEPSPR